MMAFKLDSIYPRDRWSNDSNLYNNDTVYSTTRDYLAVLVTQRVFFFTAFDHHLCVVAHPLIP